ncbi:hypothetical protein AHF37_08425 [Paragonimus kellicotti]|nr:hypothetical protein AHF37_08425 [Paragonimus kellicotti]
MIFSTSSRNFMLSLAKNAKPSGKFSTQTSNIISMKVGARVSHRDVLRLLWLVESFRHRILIEMTDFVTITLLCCLKHYLFAYILHQWEHDRLAQVDLKLDAELCTLEQELSRLDTDLRSMQDMEKYWKETAKRLDVIEHESQEVLLQTQKLLVDTAELDADFRKRLLSAPKIVRTSHVLVGANVVGATELFSPWNTPMVAGRAGQNKDKTIAADVDLSNLLTVCAVNCLSFESQTYCLRTLFGLVWFKVACDPIQSVKEKMTQSVSTIMPLDCLVVTEVECCAPPEDSGPVDCNAVEALAAYTVEFFQSRDGRSQLRSRLVGSTLESVVKNLEFIMSPYLLLGADLRAIYVAQHEVEFNAVLPMDFTLLASTQKNLVRCTPTHLILNEHGQGKMNTSLNGSSLDRIIPSGSINVSVTVFNREVHAVVVLQFKLSSLDVDVSNCPATCLDVILGRIDHRSVQQLLDTCKVAPGCLHHAVKVVNEALPSMRKVRCET